MEEGVIIQASSRSKGDTGHIVSMIKDKTGFDVVDLNEMNIGHFDYDFKNENDDFKGLFKDVTSKYKIIIFATPIYWYTMSGLLKVFFDRISDFLHRDKEIGRRLRVMKMGVVSCSNEDVVFEGFQMPFIKSAEYLGMEYLGHLHTWVENEIISKKVQLAIEDFVGNKVLVNV